VDFKLTEEQELIQRSAREYAETRLLPRVAAIIEENKVPDEVIRDLKELGFFALFMPEAYGGAGSDYQNYVLVMEQIARICPAVAVIMSVNAVGLAAVEIFGTEAQKQTFLPPGCSGDGALSFAFTEPGTGSDPKQITTTATRKGDTYILNGTKRFITNASLPGPIVIIARDKEAGEISAFIAQKFCDGYALSEPWRKLGCQGAPLYDVYLKDLAVPVENLLGDPGKGFWILKVALALGKIGISSIFLGTMLAAYEEALHYARERTHRGEPITKFQAVQAAIVDMAMKYEAARWMTYRIGYLADHAKDKGAILKDSAMAKIFVTETAVDLARIAMGIHGSYGLMQEYKISQIWRDVIFGPQVEGVSHLLKALVAGEILRGEE
jgi:alkylation response protein AidB-like acyl-CoA dehydrogenase